MVITEHCNAQLDDCHPAETLLTVFTFKSSFYRAARDQFPKKSDLMSWDEKTMPSVRSYTRFIPPKQGHEKVLSTCSLNLPH